MKRNTICSAVLAAAIGFGLVTEPSVLEAAPLAGWTAEAGKVGAEERTRGAALRPGDTIGIVAPGSNEDIKEFAKAIRDLEKLGYRLKFGDSCSANYGYFAGTDSTRAADLNRFFADDEVKAILCMRGGYGAARLLDRLDYGTIARHPKQLIGYSDITALHVVLGERCRLSTVHGPMLRSFSGGLDKTSYTARCFLKGIAGELYPGDIPLPQGRRLEAVAPGEAEGVIMGGNLSVLVSLVGTPYEMKGDGALLLIEDVGEDTYRIDRMLWQLWDNGLLRRVSGILVGDMLKADDDWEEGDFRLPEVLERYARLTGKPMIKGVPVGHGKDNVFLPLGVHAVMKANADGTASLRLDEAALRIGE